MAAINSNTSYPITTPTASDTFIAAQGNTTIQVLFSGMFNTFVGPNYARTLNVDTALSNTPQFVEVGGVNSTFKLSTATCDFTNRLNVNELTTPSLSVTGVLVASNSGIGFNGANPITKPTVTGAHEGNAALISLLNALDLRGDILNSTS